MSTLASVTAAAAGPSLASQIPPAVLPAPPSPSASETSPTVQSVAAPPPVARTPSANADPQAIGSPPGYGADGSATDSGGRSLIDIKV